MLPHMLLAPQEVRTFFVTFVAAQRRRIFQTDRNAELFLAVMQDQQTKGRMAIHAFVLMPNHVHLLLTPAEDVSLEKAVQFLKGGFSSRLKSAMDVWERGYNEERVKDAEAFHGMRTYIENNPLRAGMVVLAKDFPWSSASRLELVDPAPARFGRG